MITSHSSVPLTPALVGNACINSELNRTKSSIGSRIQDVKTGHVLLKNLPIAVMDKIASFCGLEDVANIQKARVHPKAHWVHLHKLNVIKNRYSETIEAINEWKSSSCSKDRENYDIAAKRIVDCILHRKETLDLSNLNLKSIPDISSLTFLTELNFEGNRRSVITGCLERVYGPIGYNIIKSLPKTLKKISATVLTDNLPPNRHILDGVICIDYYEASGGRLLLLKFNNYICNHENYFGWSALEANFQR